MSKRRGVSGWFSAISSALVTFLMLVLLALAVALVIIPKAMGGMSLTVLTGSMEPGIMPGDIVVTKGIDTDQARDLKIGDVIAFLPYPNDPTLVTHRIIAKTGGSQGYSFTTQGDNNDSPDSWNPVRDYQVRGEVVYVVPKLGYAREWLGSSVRWVVPVVAAVLIGYGIIAFVMSFRKPRDKAGDPPNTRHGDQKQVPVGPRRAIDDQEQS